MIDHPASLKQPKSAVEPLFRAAQISPEKVQSQLWEALHERIRCQHETQLLRHVDETIRKYYPSYRASDGRVIDRRLALRIGVSPGTLSRLRADGDGSMTRLTHFLSMLYFCGGGWDDVGFMAPQQVILDAISYVFPLAQRLLEQEATDPPTDEQILVLYFALQVEGWDTIYADRRTFSGIFEDCCSVVIERVQMCDYDTEIGSQRLVTNPKMTTSDDVERIVDKYESVWRLLLETFPFLGQSDRRGDTWGVF